MYGPYQLRWQATVKNGVVLAAGGDHRVGLGQGAAERLGGKDGAHAGFGEGDDDFGALVGPGGDADDVGLLLGDHLAEVGVERRYAPAMAEIGQLRGVYVGAGD